MFATQLTYNMKPVIDDEIFSQPPIKQLAYKSMPVLHERNVAAKKINRPRPEFSSMGFVIPFQPSMWDEESIQSVWNNAMQIVQTKLKGGYSEECINTILARLEKLFPKLDYNTHRKSLAIILTPDDEKLIYLSYPVKPLVISGKNVCLLDLVSNIQREPDFYYFILNGDSVSLYDYNNKHLGKLYEQNNEANTDNLYKNAFGVIELLNSKNEKPVFVTGSPNLVERFCNSAYYSDIFFTLVYDAAPISNEIIQSLVKEITCQWRYWQSKFIAGRVMLAQKSNILTRHIEAVLQALNKGVDGLLLIDKKLKQLLLKSQTGNVIFQLADEIMYQIEKFLVRGNRIEFTETGLLKDMGGIVLLSNATSGVFRGHSYNKHSEVNRILF